MQAQAQSGIGISFVTQVGSKTSANDDEDGPESPDVLDGGRITTPTRLNTTQEIETLPVSDT
jgi:hypothetical protein